MPWHQQRQTAPKTSKCHHYLHFFNKNAKLLKKGRCTVADVTNSRIDITSKVTFLLFARLSNCTTSCSKVCKTCSMRELLDDDSTMLPMIPL